MTISAQRSGPDENCGRSEFAYGSFTRTVTLPDGADADEINATYDRGILTVSVPLSASNSWIVSVLSCSGLALWWMRHK